MTFRRQANVNFTIRLRPNETNLRFFSSRRARSKSASRAALFPTRLRLFRHRLLDHHAQLLF